jgi:hypothetical protein
LESSHGFLRFSHRLLSVFGRFFTVFSRFYREFNFQPVAIDLENTADSLPVLTVSQFTDVLKNFLEPAFPVVWVTGEISDFRGASSSGHVYFKLKDEEAVIGLVAWKTTAQRIKTELHDGMEVVVRGHLDLYAPRGEYKLIVDELHLKGLGALELKFRQLHQKLTAEGLFAAERKRRLPAFPRRIAFVTSPTGAAVRDFLEVVRRRWTGIHVMIIPARVQGLGAAEEIARAHGHDGSGGIEADAVVARIREFTARRLFLSVPANLITFLSVGGSQYGRCKCPGWRSTGFRFEDRSSESQGSAGVCPSFLACNHESLPQAPLYGRHDPAI